MRKRFVYIYIEDVCHVACSDTTWRVCDMETELPDRHFSHILYVLCSDESSKVRESHKQTPTCTHSTSVKVMRRMCDTSCYKYTASSFCRRLSCILFCMKFYVSCSGYLTTDLSWTSIYLIVTLQLWRIQNLEGLLKLTKWVQRTPISHLQENCDIYNIIRGLKTS